MGLAFDDEHAPLYTVGQVAEMLGVQAAFLRRLDAETVRREELRGGCAPAPRVEHPRVLLGGLVHDYLPFVGALRLAVTVGSTRAPHFVRGFRRTWRLLRPVTDG